MNYQNTEWLFTGKKSSQGHLADMRFGFKILESYRSNFDTIEDAIVAMLSTSDYKGIFNKSNYAEKFD
jgi:hypothetical protein